MAVEELIHKINTYHSTIKNKSISYQSNFMKALQNAGLYVDPDSPEHYNLTDSLVVTSTEKLTYLFVLTTSADECPLTKCLGLYNKRPKFYAIRYQNRDYVCVGLKYDPKLRKVVHWKAVHYSKDKKEVKRFEAKKESS